MPPHPPRGQHMAFLRAHNVDLDATEDEEEEEEAVAPAAERNSQLDTQGAPTAFAPDYGSPSGPAPPDRPGLCSPSLRSLPSLSPAPSATSQDSPFKGHLGEPPVLQLRPPCPPPSPPPYEPAGFSPPQLQDDVLFELINEIAEAFPNLAEDDWDLEDFEPEPPVREHPPALPRWPRLLSGPRYCVACPPGPFFVASLLGPEAFRPPASYY